MLLIRKDSWIEKASLRDSPTRASCCSEIRSFSTAVGQRAPHLSILHDWMTRADSRLFEHVVTGAVVLFLLPVSLSSFDRNLCAHLRMARANERLEFCIGVSCNSAFFVSSLHTYTVSPAVCSSSCWNILILQYQNPERVLLNTIHKS